MYINYFHYLKYWFYTIDEAPYNKIWRPDIYFNENDWMPQSNEKYNLLTKDVISKRQAKSKLKDLFPSYELNKVTLFHMGPRTPQSNGSRPHKSFFRKKNYIKENKKDIY